VAGDITADARRWFGSVELTDAPDSARRVLAEMVRMLDALHPSQLDPARQMLHALIAGQRDPKTLAQMAHGVMRRKIPQLEEALTGHFEAHHTFLAAVMLRCIDTLAADIADVDARDRGADRPVHGRRAQAG
jgi:hypothetical protein